MSRTRKVFVRKLSSTGFSTWCHPAMLIWVKTCFFFCNTWETSCCCLSYLRRAGSLGQAGEPRSSLCRQSSAAFAPFRACYWGRFGSAAAGGTGSVRMTVLQSLLTINERKYRKQSHWVFFLKEHSGYKGSWAYFNTLSCWDMLVKYSSYYH